jgi:hypothetical protein
MCQLREQGYTNVLMDVSNVRSLFNEYLILKIEEIRLSEMLVTYYQSARRNIKEYFYPENHVTLHIKQMCCLEWNVGCGVFENRVLRRIFGSKRDEVIGNGENYILRSLMICTPHPILFG